MSDSNFSMPLLGDDFPSMQVATTHGPKNLPEDMKGKWFVLFSHPADFTPVCTTEFVAFQQQKEQFDELGCELIGMSVDQVFSHIKWVQWIKEALGVTIEYPIVAANDAIAARLGMLHPGKGSNTVRAVFIVDPVSKVRLIMYYPQEVGRNISEILRSVKALQKTAEGVAAPENWPNNSLIGSNVIIPPATDEQTALQRMNDYENFDWWFCHKCCD